MRPKVPPISGSWLNCSPIPTSSLRDRVTVLLFWATSCEASWDRLRHLEQLSTRYRGRIAVVAVHSPRLASECDDEVVAAALQRRPVHVPVVNDAELLTMGNLGLGGRPTVVVVDHRQRVVGSITGIDRERLLDESLEVADAEASRSRQRSGRVPVALPRVDAVGSAVRGRANLAWPSDLTVLPTGEIVVADSGNDRILTFAPDDGYRQAVAVGEVGGLSGVSNVCARGMWEVVATFPDRGSADLINLETGDRSVLIDGMVRPRGATRDKDGSIVLADAGAEQLVRVVSPSEAGAIAGTGFTGAADGAAARADLAQPIGVTRVANGLVFSEAGSNALRLLSDDGSVMTITDHDEQNPSLTEPGLLDGPAHRAKLQRPGGLTSMEDGSVVIADTANDRLRRLTKRRMRTIPLAGLVGPEAVAAIDADRVVVADTGNHRLVVVDLTRGESWTLELTNLLPPDRGPAERPVDEPAPLRGRVGQSIRCTAPTPGRGPWSITVRSEPEWLTGRPMTVRRTRGGQPIAVDLKGSGQGTIVVRSESSDARRDVVRIAVDITES